MHPERKNEPTSPFNYRLMAVSFLSVILLFLLSYVYSNPSSFCSNSPILCVRDWLIAVAPAASVAIAVTALIPVYRQTAEMQAQRRLMLEERKSSLQNKYAQLAQSVISLRNNIGSQRITTLFVNKERTATFDHCISLLHDFDQSATLILNFPYAKVSELRSAAMIMDAIQQARRHISEEIPLFFDEELPFSLDIFFSDLDLIYERVADHGDLLLKRAIELQVDAALISESIDG